MKGSKLMLTLCLLITEITSTCSLDPYFWHITDFHMDPTYWTTQDSCNEDIPKDQLGEFGDYRCDAPYELIRSSIKGMKDQGREPEFILYTGDTPPHPKDKSVLSEQYVFSLIENVTKVINDSFPFDKKVVAIGNHDFYPTNMLPGTTNPQYEALADLWSPWFGQDATILETFRKGAYYTQMISPEKKLRVVVTNSNLYLTSNKVTEGQDDPAGQYAWLSQVLSQARADGDNVHLIAHVPFGKMPGDGHPSWIRDADNTRFNNIVRKYGDAIMGFYSCHEHLDSFRLYYNDLKEPVVALLVAPSVSPWISRYGPNGTYRGNAHNPGIRKISFDKTKGHLTDVEQYYLNLPKANDDTEVQAGWTRLYGFRAMYGLDNITAPSLHRMVESFKEYANTDFHNWYDMRVVDARHPNNVPCSCDCKYSYICTMQEVEYPDFEQCLSEVACGVCGQFSFLSHMMLIVALIVCKMMACSL